MCAWLDGWYLSASVQRHIKESCDRFVEVLFSFFFSFHFGVGSGVGKCRASRGRVGSILFLLVSLLLFLLLYFFRRVVVVLFGFVVVALVGRTFSGAFYWL